MTPYELRVAERMNARAALAYAAYGRPVPRTVALRDWGNLNRRRPGETLLPMREPARCGTASGYKRHTRDRTPPCDACKEANTAEKRAGTGRRMGRNAA